MQLSNYEMKKNGMFILHKTDFDDIATMVLREYMPYVLSSPQPLNVELLAKEAFFLDVSYARLSPMGEVLGLIAFANTDFCPYGAKADEYMELQEGQILLDDSLVDGRVYGRRRFTLAHELSHWICHRSYHSPDNRRYEFRRGVVACRTENIEQNRRKQQERTDAYWEEWQADNLAAALLMPKDMFVEVCRDTFGKYGVFKGYLRKGVDDPHVAHEIIQEIANKFAVSFRAAQIHMKEFGFVNDRAIV